MFCVRGAQRREPEDLVEVSSRGFCGAAFLLWDSVPDFVKSDHEATKEELEEAFGHRQALERFGTSLAARTRAGCMGRACRCSPLT